MHCDKRKDCNCILCKELSQNFQLKNSDTHKVKSNFILRRTAAFRQRAPPEETKKPSDHRKIITDIYAIPNKLKQNFENNIYESIRSIKSRQKKLFLSHENLNNPPPKVEANLAACFNEMRLIQKLDRTLSDATLDVKSPELKHKSVIYVSDSWRRNTVTDESKMETLNGSFEKQKEQFCGFEKQKEQFYTIELNNNCANNVIDTATQVNLTTKISTDTIDSVTVLTKCESNADDNAENGQLVVSVLYQNSYKNAMEIIDSLNNNCAFNEHIKEQYFDANDLFPVESESDWSFVQEWRKYNR